MVTLSKPARMILVIAVAADIMIFSRITILPLTAIAVGSALVLLGIEYSYRLASLAGLLVVALTGAAAIEITTLLELGTILTASIGLLIPILVLTWLALSSEEGEKQEVSVMTRPAAISLAFAFICLWSAPVIILVMSLMTPTISMRLTATTETAIVLIATVGGGVFLTRRKPAITRPSA